MPSGCVAAHRAVQHVHPALMSEPLEQRRIFASRTCASSSSARDARERKCFERVELDLLRAVREQVLGDVTVPGAQRLLIRRAAAAQAGRVHVHAVLDEQLDAFEKILLAAQHNCWTSILPASHSHRQTIQPRTALLLSQAVFERRAQVIVVVLEVTVVERLRVVGIGAGLEQQPRERIALRMRRLIRPVLAPSERASQGGERVRPENRKPALGSAPRESSSRATPASNARSTASSRE